MQFKFNLYFLCLLSLQLFRSMRRSLIIIGGGDRKRKSCSRFNTARTVFINFIIVKERAVFSKYYWQWRSKNAKIVPGLIVLGRIIVQSHKLTLWHDGRGGTNTLCWSIKPLGSALRSRNVQHHQRYKIRTNIHFHCQRINNRKVTTYSKQ
jgi:hypothetical protein